MPLAVTAHEIVKTMQAAAGPDSSGGGSAFVLGTVSQMSSDGRSAKVVIDGDNQDSGVFYPIIFSFGTMGPDTNALPLKLTGTTVAHPGVFISLTGSDSHGDNVTVFGSITIPSLNVTVPGELNFPLSSQGFGKRVLLASVGHSMVILGELSPVTLGVLEH